MRAEILAVGSELLTPSGRRRTAPTSPARCSRRASRRALASRWPTTGELLESAFRTALSRADVVIVDRRARPHRGRPHARGGRRRPRPPAGRGEPGSGGRAEGALRALRPRDGTGQREAGRRHRGRHRAAQPARHRARTVASRAERPPAVPAARPAGRDAADVRAAGPATAARRAGPGRAAGRESCASRPWGRATSSRSVAPVYTTFKNPRTTILGGARPGRAAPDRRAVTAAAEAEARIEALAAGLRAAAARAHLQRGRPRAARGGGGACCASAA